MGNRRASVVFVGSSSVAGKGQVFDVVGELRGRPGNERFAFHNLGVGGDLSYNALAHVTAVAAARPAKIVVMIGGNDILASVFGNLRRMLTRWKRLPVQPSLELLQQNLIELVSRLQEQTSADIGLVSLGQVGEDPGASDSVQGRLNMLYEEARDVVCAIAAGGHHGYIPFYERLHEQIVASPGRALTAFRIGSFYRDTFRYFVLRRSGEDIARVNGWQFHVDGIHLNRRGGMILADCIQQFIDN
jgi:hypothetical protein